MKEINNPEWDNEISLKPDSLRQQEKHIQEAGDEIDNMSLAKGAETSECKKPNAENGSLKSKDTSESEDPLDAYSSDGTKSDVKDETVFSNKERSFLDRFKGAFGKESACETEENEDSERAGAFNEVPYNRRESVYDAFENSPNEIKDTVNELSSKLSVESALENDCCHYDPNSKTIRMEDNLSNIEYAEVFTHEYGHFVDNMKGDVSVSPEFKNAVSMDLANYDRSTAEGRQNFNQMMDDLMDSDAAFDRTVSDNMSAYFYNDWEVIKRYYDEDIRFYKHENSYWHEDGNRESEIYANTFSMIAQDNKASCEFIQQYFPHTWEAFNNTL